MVVAVSGVVAQFSRGSSLGWREGNERATSDEKRRNRTNELSRVKRRLAPRDRNQTAETVRNTRSRIVSDCNRRVRCACGILLPIGV